MADPQYSVKKITDLTTNPSTNDSDLYVLGNQGTATMRKITFSTIASAILNKLTSFTFNSLTTSSKNLPGAVNELNTNSGGSVVTRSLTASDYDAQSPSSDHLRTMWGIVDNYGIVSFDTSWIRLQLRTNGSTMQCRARYGQGNPTAWTDLWRANTLTTVNLSKASIAKTTKTTVGTITLGAGTYMVVSYLNLSKSGTSSYNHDVTGSVVGSRVVRSTEMNGGGSCNVGFYNGNQTLTVSIYTVTVDNFTATGAIQAMKLT